ncbi:MAG TPA: HipA domain-containing protein [Fimbriimonadaceae bacterium]|nr:HipA domain-containing protein [Fimbriimonadaceae bacterium]
MPDADVYQGSRLVAHFERTASGLRLTYNESAPLERGCLATTLEPVTTDSIDLPAFFLNLLPEGARLQLLLESARSRDDSLDLLLRVGWDTAGDVAVVPHGVAPGGPPSVIEARLEDVSFWELFAEGISKRPDSAVPGAQEKISASTVAFGVRAAHIPSAILKLNPPRFPRLVQNEEFFLRMARSCGIKVNDAVVVHDKYGEPGLLVTRFDRVKQGNSVRKLHQEDGCQLLDSIPANKYDVSLLALAKAITRVSTAPIVEIERLLRLIAFSYLIGNGDLHAKNVSVLWGDTVRLSPAYDLLSTLPYSFVERRMALKLMGKDDNFRTADFVEFGTRFQLPESAVHHMVADLCRRAEPWIARFDEIGFEPKETQALQRAVSNRIQRLRR